jgi:hypothetical protein
MPLTPDFSVTQSTVDYRDISFIDTSTGSDPAIESRRIFLLKTNGDYLTTEVTNYIPWSYDDSTIDINDLIDKDYALLVTVEWLDVDGEILYTSTKVCGFQIYNLTAEYNIIQALTVSPVVAVSQKDYWYNLGRVQTWSDNVDWSVYYQRQVIAQAAINRMTNLLSNPIPNF